MLQSTTVTFLLWCFASALPKFTATVVFPTPPLPETIPMTLLKLPTRINYVSRPFYLLFFALFIRDLLFLFFIACSFSIAHRIFFL
jgi:hypothetical protein